MQDELNKIKDAFLESLKVVIKSVFIEVLENTMSSPEKGIEIVDTKELCERLNITEPTVIRWRKKGKIPFLQIGSAIRFDYGAVIQALEVNRKGFVR